MVNVDVPVGQLPDRYRRIVKAWYVWQGFYLWSRGQHPGEADRLPAKWETAERVFWGAEPPKFLADESFAFENAAGDLRYFVTDESGIFFIDVEERGSRERYWMFHEFDDLEKYLLFVISQDAYPGAYDESLRARWRKQGVDPRVTLTQPDPENYPGRMAITVIGENLARCWMGRSDAIAFSHGIHISYEELDRMTREGLPVEGFQVVNEQ